MTMARKEVEAAVCFRTARCICRKITRRDVHLRCAWGPYDTPLLSYYTLKYDSPAERDALYRRWMQMDRLWFAVDHAATGEFIALLSLRNIRRVIRSARLGIVVKPTHVNRGFGTEILRGFLEYYFTVMKYRVLYLDVAAFNRRAFRCYEKCGFVPFASFEREYAGDPAVVRTREFREAARFFTWKNGRLHARFIDMKITRAAWRAGGEGE